MTPQHNAATDYLEGPARRARLGARELWILDPLLQGPAATGGPFLLQIGQRSDAAEAVEMERLHAGDTPADSPVLDAWVVTTEDGRHLRVADDADRTRLWPTEAEAEAEARRAEAARAVAAEERAAAAEAEVERLRALLNQENT